MLKLRPGKLTKVGSEPSVPIAAPLINGCFRQRVKTRQNLIGFTGGIWQC